MIELSPSQKIKVEGALLDFFGRTGELSVDLLLRTLQQNDLTIVADGDEFARGMRHVLELAEEDRADSVEQHGRYRREGLGRLEWSFTVSELGALVQGALEQ